MVAVSIILGSFIIGIAINNVADAIKQLKLK